ncbi:MAG: tetratricopeptide repeat protein [Bacteroidota bacterium]
MEQTSTATKTFSWQHGLLIGIGALVFVLLIFADNTNLKKENAAAPMGGAASSIPAGGTASANSDALLSMLPPAEPDESTATLLTALQGEADPATRDDLLRSVVNGFREEGRLDIAAVYAGDLASQNPEVKNLIVAGALFRNASQTPAIQADSSIFRMFSDEGLRYLNQAVAKEPQNEDALLELGLTMVVARRGEMSMQGIFKIREVVELNPRNTEALFHLGKFSMETAQYDKAEGRFRSILELEPTNHEAKYFLAQAVRQMGRSAESNTLMAEVAEQQQNPELAAMAQMALKPN